VKTNTRFHGITSIGLVGISIALAAIVMFQASLVLGIVYVAGCALAPLAIAYAFCAKCPCRGQCAHVLFGKLALALTDRRPGPYTPLELAAVLLGLLWLLGLPQPWLWTHPGLAVAFWLLNAVAVLQIRLAVCPGCANAHCPLRVVR
jgi:hypothetical protein